MRDVWGIDQSRSVQTPAFSGVCIVGSGIGIYRASRTFGRRYLILTLLKCDIWLSLDQNLTIA
jgi:hypothetical protein